MKPRLSDYSPLYCFSFGVLASGLLGLLEILGSAGNTSPFDSSVRRVLFIHLGFGAAVGFASFLVWEAARRLKKSEVSGSYAFALISGVIMSLPVASWREAAPLW